METCWIPDRQLREALRRNEAYWDGELEDYPLMWVSAPDAKPGPSLPEPADETEMWTNVDYAITAGEYQLARTHYAGDALPFYNPWLGPDQFAGWLGAKLTLRPRDYTSWATPFVSDWERRGELTIHPENTWWKLYRSLLEESVRAGKGKWVTTFPDLHAGIDALSAIRGPENLLVDMLANPEPVHRAMNRMTPLWKWVVDEVWNILKTSGQGTTNWTGGWSEKRFVCIGHNDFTCMIGPEMFDAFCLRDTLECVNYVDHALYHLDGPGALRHLPRLLEMERLHTVQWVHGNGQPPHSHWLDILKRIQQAGKAVQIWYNLHYTTHVVNVFDEIETVCAALNPTRLFIGVEVSTAEQADAVVEHAQRVCRAARA
jgi:hypothetical protein